MKRLFQLILLFFLLLFSDQLLFAQAEFFTDKLDVYVNAYGRIRIYSLPDTLKQLERASLLVATAPDAVFDFYNDQDVEDSTKLIDNPSWGDYEIYGAYNNNYSALPPDVLLKQYIFGWQSESFIIVKYVVVNREPSATSAVLGLELIPQIENMLGMDTVVYSQSNGIIDAYRSNHLGFKILSDNPTSVNVFEYYDGYYEDTSYYNWLTNSNIDTFFTTQLDDPVIIAGIPSQSFYLGDSLIFFEAIAFGETENDMMTSMEAAIAKYAELTSVYYDNSYKVSDFSLAQNFPNPFNPTTKISFSLPSRQNVILKVFNSIGQEVAELVNRELFPGKYTVDFNASSLSSGVYFYKISAGDFSLTKKMLLLK